MTATTTTTITGLPKNKTGLFAADTLHDVKSTRNQPITVPTLLSPYRQTGSSNLSEQNHHSLKSESQQSYTNNLHLNINGIRNGFRPSTLRRQKSRIPIAIKHRDNNYRDLKDFSSKQPFTPSLASARLRSEVDHLNSRLKSHGDLNKILRSQPTRDASGTPHSAISYSTSCRLSSASTNHTASRIHQRFSSAMTNGTVNTLVSIPTVIDTSDKCMVGIAAPSPPINEEEDDNQSYGIQTHAYQIPQQSNVGNESIFPLNPSSSLPSKKVSRRYNGKKSISCPFYVMYFTNLAIQQRENNIPLSISTLTTRKERVNSRSTGSHTRHQSTRRQINSPISMNTYSTIVDDDSMINKTSYYNNKRFSAKIAAFENENSHLLKDILRTTSWNHVQV